MSQYCYVTNNTVETGPAGLPANWRDPVTGVPYGNLPAMQDSALLVLGWYPYVEQDPGVPGPYYTAEYADFVVNPTNVSRSISYIPWPIEQVRNIKNSELESQLEPYTFNDEAVNPHVREYVRDDVKWGMEQQANLTRLEDWAQVAAFDPDKPAVPVLPNSYLGDKYVRQGVALTGENQAYLDTGQPAPWDQTVIDSFVSANQVAAADSSDATAPQHPGYKIRQGIAKVGEEFRRLLLVRFNVVGETDPTLDRSMRMRIPNRQDTRDLYTLIFTDAGVTFLGAQRFEKVNGNWEWVLVKDAPAERDLLIMQNVDTDLAIVLSYGENPAVEADWFTDKIQFPAGVEQMDIFASWDPV